MLAFARSFLGFLGLVVGSFANYALMLAIAVFAAPYWAFAYSIVSLIAGALIEEGIADNYENSRSKAKAKAKAKGEDDGDREDGNGTENYGDDNINDNIDDNIDDLNKY